MVPKVSLDGGLVYTYTKPQGDTRDPWYLTALNFRTGRTVWKQLAGYGLGHNNNYAPVTIGPDNGTAYVGALGGLIALRDARRPKLPRSPRLKVEARCGNRRVRGRLTGDRRTAGAAGAHRGAQAQGTDRSSPFRIRWKLRRTPAARARADRRPAARRAPAAAHEDRALPPLARRPSAPRSPTAPRALPRRPRAWPRRRSRGRCPHRSTIACTASGSPSNTASTVPSSRFFTQPATPRLLGLAADRVAEEHALHPAVRDHPPAHLLVAHGADSTRSASISHTRFAASTAVV